MSSIKQITANNNASPVTLAELKKHIGFAESDTSRDDYFTALLEAATNRAQLFTGRQFLPAEYQMRFTDFPTNDEVKLSPNPVSAVSAVAYKNTSEEDTALELDTDYYIDLSAEPAELTFIHTYSVASYCATAVTINYTAGYSAADTVPPAIKLAVKLIAADMYVNPTNRVDNLPTVATNILKDFRVYD